MPSRPSSAGPRRRPQSAGTTRELAHGASDPRPDAGATAAGPGIFRSFTPTSRYNEFDPLQHGSPGVSANGASEPSSPSPTSPYAMGSQATFHSLSEFRTIDISKVNESRHKWQRLDTFQTPFGHVGDIEDLTESPKRSKSKNHCFFRFEMLEQIQQELSASFQEIRHTSASLFEEMRRLRAEVQIFRGQKLDMEQVLQVIHQNQLQAEANFSEVLEAVRQKRCDVDLTELNFSELLQAIQKKNFDAEFIAVLEAIKANKVDVSFSEVLEAIQQKKVNVDFTSVLEAIDAKKVEVNFSEVLQAIHQSNLQEEANFSEVLGAIQQTRFDVDFTSVFEAIDAKEVKVNLSEVLEAIHQKRCDADVTSILEAIDAKKLEVNFSEVLHAIQQKNFAADFSAVLEAIKSNKVEVNFSEVLEAIDAKQVQVNFSEVLQSIQQKNFAAEFSSVLEAVKANKVDIKFSLLEAINTKRCDVDFTSVFEALEVIKADMNFAQVVDCKFAEMQQTIRDMKLDVDITSMTQSIENFQQSLRMDIKPALDAITSLDASVKATAEARVSLDAKLITIDDFDKMYEKLEDIDGNGEQLKRLMDGGNTSLLAGNSSMLAKMQCYHEESMMELSKVANAMTSRSPSHARSVRRDVVVESHAAAGAVALATASGE
ncbi:unnamed protein product [Effrenium voratum]|nr:unnamed protein product [Effrenium voratum]